MSGSRLQLSIIIINWNTLELLERCLQSAVKAVEGLAAEILVVDNGSTDGSQAMVRQDFPSIRLIENQENVGFAAANNQAIRQSSGKYILLLNSDAFLEPAAARKMVSLLDRHPGIGIIGARLTYPDGSLQPSHWPLPTFIAEVKSLFGLDKAPPTEAGVGVETQFVETGTVLGACLMIRRAVLEQIGLLDEAFFMFSEEVDLCYRAHQAGWKVVHQPSAMAVHVGGGSTGTMAGRYLMLYRGKLRYFAKHHGARIERRLLRSMQLAALLKLTAYTLLRGASLGRVRKDELWRSISKGLLSF